MKGRWFLFLFAIPFAGVAVWAGWSISTTVYDAWQMSQWPSTSATIVSGGYSSHTGEDSTTYEAYATYRYRIGVVDYSNDRVAISQGADNIGDFQQRIGRSLQTAVAEQLPMAVYYNPDDPQDSILFPELRWGLLAFKGVFLLVFGGFGFGAMYFSLRAGAPKDPEDPAYTDAPWLANDNWQGAAIRSGSRSAMFASLGFAAFWNLVSMPLPFLLFDEVLKKGNYMALVGLLFPAVGVGLIIWAVGRTREWRRYGPTPVTLDPFPGAIGGHVGGSIDINVPYSSTTEYRVTLTNLRRTTSGSGKNRSTRETALWQADGRAAAEPGPRGTRVLFRFDVPEGQQASDAIRQGNSSVSWKLNLAADLPGVDLDRDYEIPVYPTGASSSRLPESTMQAVAESESRADEQAVLESLNFQHTPGGKQLHFPPFRNFGMNVMLFVIGAVFAGAGWYLMFREGETFMGFIFGGIGSLLAIAGLYTLLNSLTVTANAGSLTAVRRLLGVPVSTRSMSIAAVKSLSHDSSMKSQSGGKHVIYYTISAHDLHNNKLTLAEGLKGNDAAQAAKRVLAREFGIRLEQESRSRRDEQEDILAADR